VSRARAARYREQLFAIDGLQLPMPLQLTGAPLASLGQGIVPEHACVHTVMPDIM
jgi:hypothetical protein